MSAFLRLISVTAHEAARQLSSAPGRTTRNSPSSRLSTSVPSRHDRAFLRRRCRPPNHNDTDTHDRGANQERRTRKAKRANNGRGPSVSILITKTHLSLPHIRDERGFIHGVFGARRRSRFASASSSLIRISRCCSPVAPAIIRSH
jgi:hypothetical protein